MTADLRFNIALTLRDYFELRAFYLRRYVARNSLIFFGFLIAGGLVIPELSGLPPALLLRVAERNWTYYALTILGVFLLVRLLPFVSMLLLWLRGKLPRRMQLAADEKGIAYTLLDTDVLLHWPALTGIVRTRSAYYIRAKARIVRLPLREMDKDQRAAFEALAARHGVTVS